jgi:hypothetical protein
MRGNGSQADQSTGGIEAIARKGLLVGGSIVREYSEFQHVMRWGNAADVNPGTPHVSLFQAIIDMDMGNEICIVGGWAGNSPVLHKLRVTAARPAFSLPPCIT